MNATCPTCQHPATEHSAIAGCLADGCLCESGPVVAAFEPPRNEPLSAQRAAGLAEGRRRRDEGAEAAGSTAPGALVTSWRAEAATAMDALILGGQEFDADDLVDMVGMPPRPNMLGGLFIGASRAKRIVPVGYTQATRPSSHARIQRTWKAAPQ